MFLLLIPFLFRRFILESSSSSIVIHVSITPFFQSNLEPFPRLTLDTCRLLLASTGLMPFADYARLISYITQRLSFRFFFFVNYPFRPEPDSCTPNSMTNVCGEHREHGGRDPIGEGIYKQNQAQMLRFISSR